MSHLLQSEGEPKPLAPPPERFWQRYSLRHELPLSGAGSLTLHALILGSLVLLALGVVHLRTASPRLGIDTLPVGEEDAPPDGSNPKGSQAATSTQQENVPRISEQPPVPVEPHPRLEPAPAATPQARFSPLGPPNAGSKEVEDALKGLQKKPLPSAGVPRTPGGGPGKKGHPPGSTTDGPPQVVVPPSQRWHLTFDTNFNGHEYLKQLAHFKGVLAIPTGSGEPPPGYLIVRNLAHRSPQIIPGDVSEFQGIAWVDSRPESVLSVTRALNLDLRPDKIIAFFPSHFEEQLRRLERQRAGNLPVERIESTSFKVRRSPAGSYEPYVVAQQLR